jgi:hypothetical protein
MTDYAGLYQEIQDPKYAGMTDQQISDAINNESVTIDLSPAPTLGADVYNAIPINEWQTTPSVRAGPPPGGPTQQEVRDVWQHTSVDIALGTSARDTLDAAYPSGTAAYANFIALTQQTMTLAAQLGFVEVTPHEIAAARIYGAP